MGLDVDLDKLPKTLDSIKEPGARVVRFNREIVEATYQYACAYKLNSAHYEKMGIPGLSALKATITEIQKSHPDIPIIVDAKRGDIAETNEYYAQGIFDELGVDAATVHPYMGRQSLLPFLSRADKGVIVMGANSAKGAEEFQDLPVGASGDPLYLYICRQVATKWNENNNCAVTAGADNPAKLGRIRQVIGEMPILLLGIGAQGGDLKACLNQGIGTQSFGLIINSSRAILYASAGDDYGLAAGKAARAMNEDISQIYSELLKS